MDADLLRDRLRERFDATGKKPVPVAVTIGKGRDYLTDFLKGDKNSLSSAVLQALARQLECGVEYLMDASVTDPGAPAERLVPVVGRVGANSDDSIIYTTADDADTWAPLPPGGTPDAAALEVVGHSMRWVAEDGSLIYFEQQRNPPSEDMLGDIVIVETEAGQVLVKRLLRGSSPQHFDLESQNGPPLRDQRLVWAAEITAIIPPRQARRVIRRTGEAA